MKKTAFLFVVLWTASPGLATAQQFEFPVAVSDGTNSQVMILGVHPNGPDGFDIGLDQLAPPPPFPGAFDVRYRIGTEDFLTDIRFNDAAQKTVTMLYQEAAGQGPIVLTWDRQNLPSFWTFDITDNVNGNLFGPLDMTSVNTLDVSSAGGLLDPGLRILVTGVSQATRYVATGGSDTGNAPMRPTLAPRLPTPSARPTTAISSTWAPISSSSRASSSKKNSHTGAGRGCAVVGHAEGG